MSPNRPAIRPLLLAVASFAGIFLAGLLAAWIVGAYTGVETNAIDRSVASRAVDLRDARPGLTDLFLGLTRLGDFDVGAVLVVLVAVGIAVMWRRGVRGIRGADLAYWVVLIGGGKGLVEGLKAWVARGRPPLEGRLVEETSYSFPSGHAMMSAVFLTGLAFLAVRLLRSRGIGPAGQVAVVAVCLVLALSIAASRVWLGVHYLSDVSVGFALGVGWAALISWIRARYGPRSDEPTPKSRA